MNREKGKIRVFAAGGAGFNLATSIYDQRNESRDGFADISFAFIDTSKSNLSDKIDKDDVYAIEGLDGSGQKRSQNHEEIIPRIKDIVQNFKPGNLNIVLHSLSGG